MKDYLLFIDTEASDLPKRWDRPYNHSGNWPCAVQVAWIVFDAKGNKVKSKSYYVNEPEILVNKHATKIHGVTKVMLQQKGIERARVLALLAKDIATYKPLIVGHFIELDYHVIAADSSRAHRVNPLENQSLFCTMLATKHLVKNPVKNFLRLYELYELLFKKNLVNRHNAIDDSEATAACFFELLRRGEITENTLAQQQIKLLHQPAKAAKGCLGFIALGLIFLIILL